MSFFIFICTLNKSALFLISPCISVPRLAVVKEMIRRLQELRHTDQVQRAYALNCGEGATVSYELQIRVLREFGLPDGAAELLQVTQHILFAWRLTCVAMATVNISDFHVS